MFTVYYRPQNEQPRPRRASTTLNGVLLEPGSNSLTASQLDALKAHPDYAAYSQWGAISIPDQIPLFEAEAIAAPPAASPKKPRPPKASPASNLLEVGTPND